MWQEKIIQIFKIREIRNKILFILAVFVIFRIMANIPIPGINIENLKNFFNQFQMFGLLNIFTGGALDNLSIVMLGLGPYITAVIIFQLLTMIFPQLEKIYKEEGEAGRQRFNQYCRIATVPLAALQAFAMLKLFQQQGIIGELSPLILFSSIITITAGALFLMWLGEIISEKGIGNGVSLLIFAGIVADFPHNVYQAYVDISTNPYKISDYFMFFLFSLLIIAGVVLVNEARRNIPVSYAKRVKGMRLYGGVSTYLPLNVNPAGVIPIIFALSILLVPSMISTILGGFMPAGKITEIVKMVAAFFDFQRNPVGYGIIYFLLVFLFTYFYTAVTFDPKAIAKNLQKMGGFIPGIRPGESTANFMNYILNRVLLVGAIFLGAIAVLPQVITAITEVRVFHFLIGGTSLLIVVSVVLETWRQINAQLEMREYDNF